MVRLFASLAAAEQAAVSGAAAQLARLAAPDFDDHDLRLLPVVASWPAVTVGLLRDATGGTHA